MSIKERLERVKKNTPWATERIQRIEELIHLVSSGLEYTATGLEGQVLRGKFVFFGSGVSLQTPDGLYHLSALRNRRPVFDLTEIKKTAELDDKTCLAEFELRGSAFNALYSFSSKKDLREFTRVINIGCVGQTLVLQITDGKKLCRFTPAEVNTPDFELLALVCRRNELNIQLSAEDLKLLHTLRHHQLVCRVFTGHIELGLHDVQTYSKTEIVTSFEVCPVSAPNYENLYNCYDFSKKFGWRSSSAFVYAVFSRNEQGCSAFFNS